MGDYALLVIAAAAAVNLAGVLIGAHLNPGRRLFKDATAGRGYQRAGTLLATGLNAFGCTDWSQGRSDWIWLIAFGALIVPILVVQHTHNRTLGRPQGSV